MSTWQQLFRQPGCCRTMWPHKACKRKWGWEMVDETYFSSHLISLHSLLRNMHTLDNNTNRVSSTHKPSLASERKLYHFYSQTSQSFIFWLFWSLCALYTSPLATSPIFLAIFSSWTCQHGRKQREDNCRNHNIKT